MSLRPRGRISSRSSRFGMSLPTGNKSQTVCGYWGGELHPLIRTLAPSHPRTMRRCSLFILAVLTLPAAAQDEFPKAKPVPRMQVLPLSRNEASVERDGQEIARYY